MRTVEDLSRYLLEIPLKVQDLGNGMFIVDEPSGGLHNLAIKVEQDVVVFQLRIRDLPDPSDPTRTALYETLLKLNGSGLLHAAFALLDDGVYLQAALPLANLDASEVQAVVDDIGLAVSQHVAAIRAASQPAAA